MSTDDNPESNDRSNGKLRPEFYTRLYPGGWDLSEHCAPRKVSKPVESMPEKDKQVPTSGSPPAPEKLDPFPYDSSPRIFQFPSGYFVPDETSDPF